MSVYFTFTLLVVVDEPMQTAHALIPDNRPITVLSSLCPASYGGCKRATARICCCALLAAAMSPAINPYLTPAGPTAANPLQWANDGTDRDGRTPDRFIDRTPHSAILRALSQYHPTLLSTTHHSISTQPCILPGSLNRVPASAGVRAGMSPLPDGR